MKRSYLANYTPKGSEAAKRKMAYLRSLRGQGKPKLDADMRKMLFLNAAAAQRGMLRKLGETVDRMKSAKLYNDVFDHYDEELAGGKYRDLTRTKYYKHAPSVKTMFDMATGRHVAEHPLTYEGLIDDLKVKRQSTGTGFIEMTKGGKYKPLPFRKFIKSMWSGRRGDPQKLKEVIARLEEERRRDTEERIANDNGSGW